MGGKRKTPARVAAALARRGSGAAGTMGDRRTKRKRDRGAQERAAIRDQA